MSVPALAWRRYALGGDPGADRFLQQATIELPDLTGRPSPLDKARILLESAAEVEHALMVQYLYAAYSLKGSGDVADPLQQAALDETSPDAWPSVLLGIAREEMGHLMTVQNLLLALGLPPSFEREDFPPRKDLYPFAVHLERLSQRSLAKYVVAEAPAGAAGIEDVVALARDSAGAPVNRVGVLYGLLGVVFATAAQVSGGGSGSAEWDELVRRLAGAAYQQAPADAWHLPDAALAHAAGTQQADPEDWQVAGLRVHRIADRAAAVRALRDVGEQGEGPTGAAAASHFERLLGMYRGRNGLPPFPAAGAWVPTREVPTDPQPQDVVDPVTRAWTELADLRYALLLGFLEHHLVASGHDRDLLAGWAFAEMRSQIAPLARRLTALPLGGAGGGVAAFAFTLPGSLHLPGAETARWAVHGATTEAAVAKVDALRASDAGLQDDPFLATLRQSDAARLDLIRQRIAVAPTATSFARDIRPLFSPKDVQHMLDIGLDLDTYAGVRDAAPGIAERLKGTGPRRMPPPPDQPWTSLQTALFDRWMAEGFPP